MNEIVQGIINCRAYFEDFITRSTHHSNAIEGNTLSMAETYAIIFNDNSIKITAEPREIYEAINHKYALDYLFKHIDDDLSEGLIINIAKLINKNINEIDGYRKTQVFIRGAEHIPPAPNMIKQQMLYFLHNYHNTVYDNVFEKAAKAHIAFERIHPFSDGNGRTGRLLINFEILKSGYAPVVITKENRAEYLKMIAEQNAPALTDYLKALSTQERERAENFFGAEKNVSIIETEELEI